MGMEEGKKPEEHNHISARGGEGGGEEEREGGGEEEREGGGGEG